MSSFSTQRLRLVLMLGAALLGSFPDQLRGHGDLVELSVSHGQLVTNTSTYTSSFSAPVPGVPGIPALTELPGLGVSGPLSGLLPGTPLELEVADKLWFSTGEPGGSVTDTAATLTIFDPDFTFGAEYLVTQDSQELTGMGWATYPGGIWEAHGTYTLDAAADPAGAYGLLLRVDAPQYVVSDPFLVVFSAHNLDPGRFQDALQQIESAALQSSAPGDYTGEGTLTAADIDLLSAAVRQGTHDAAFDLTNDGLVNGEDRTTWVEELYGTAFGDANLDFSVTASADGSILLAALGSPGLKGWADGDFNGDGTVTASGDGSLLLNGLTADAAGSDPAPLPEPSTLLILAMIIGFARILGVRFAP